MVAINLLSVAPAFAAQSSLMPDISQVTEMYDQVSNTLTNAFNINPDDVATQGATGEDNAQDTSTSSEVQSDTKSSEGGVSTTLSQKEHWSIDNELEVSSTDWSKFGEEMTCMQYSLVGGCLSVRWTMFGPKYTTNFAVEHFVRDLHVEVIPQAPNETDPSKFTPGTTLPSSTEVASDEILMYPTGWKLAKSLGDKLLINSISNNILNAEGQTVITRRNRFLYSDVHVAGNVEMDIHAAYAKTWLSSFGYCSSTVIQGLVYFSSQLDQFSWRWLATTETVLMGLYQGLYLEWNDVGRSYGSTYPRSGYITNTPRFKTAVTSVIRAVNIPTENRAWFSGLVGLHIYFPISPYAQNSYRADEYLTPQDAKSYRLEMIYPFKDSCTRYGADQSYFGNLTSNNIFVDDKLVKKFAEKNGHNTAAFKVYRPFRCCEIRGQQVMSWTTPGPIGSPRKSPISK